MKSAGVFVCMRMVVGEKRQEIFKNKCEKDNDSKDDRRESVDLEASRHFVGPSSRLLNF